MLFGYFFQIEESFVHKVFYYLRLYFLFISYPFRKTFTANVCHHLTKKTGQIIARGKKSILSMPQSANGNPDYCLECIAGMAIQCAWCENTIGIGDPVTLYIPKKSYQTPSHAVRYHEDERCLVGCLGLNCADTGADRQGFWMPPGNVHRVPSPIEMIMSGGKDCSVIIVNDIHDPNDLGTMH